MKTKLLLALMACMCVVSCKKDSDATNGADDSIYGVYDVVWYDGVDYRHDLLFVDGKPADEVDRNLLECAEKAAQDMFCCCTFDDVVKHYEGKLTDTVKKSELDNTLEDQDAHFEMKIIPIDKSNHTAKIKMWNKEYDARIFENTIFIDFREGEKDFEIKYKGGNPTKLYLMSEILGTFSTLIGGSCGEQSVSIKLNRNPVYYLFGTKVREL